MWDEIRRTIASEFSDLPDASGVTRVCLRLLVATFLGGVLGWERERSGKAAGLRTHILVALGSCVFVMVPMEMGTPKEDITRVLQGLIAGIGFLGAGAIIKHQGGGGSDQDVVATPSGAIPTSPDDSAGDRAESSSVQGLTTAASVWMTAAIGMSAGLGRELTAIISTLFALAVLSLLPRIEPKR